MRKRFESNKTDKSLTEHHLKQLERWHPFKYTACFHQQLACFVLLNRRISQNKIIKWNAVVKISACKPRKGISMATLGQNYFKYSASLGALIRPRVTRVGLKTMVIILLSQILTSSPISLSLSLILYLMVGPLRLSTPYYIVLYLFHIQYTKNKYMLIWFVCVTWMALARSNSFAFFPSSQFRLREGILYSWG